MARALFSLAVSASLFVLPIVAQSTTAVVPAVSDRQAVLRGIVTTDQPVEHGEILLYTGHELLQRQPDKKLYNGTFSLPLNPAAQSALLAGKLRVEVQTSSLGQAVTLTLDAAPMSADSRALFINPMTTVDARYHDLHPAFSAAQATTIANAAFGIGSSCSSTTLSSFNNQAVLSQSRAQRGFDAYARFMADGVDTGQTLKLASSLGSSASAEALGAADGSLNFPAVFDGLLKKLASAALSALPGGTAAFGWVIEEAFKPQNQSPEQLKKIAEQLKAIAAQQDAILGSINDLSLQVAKNQQAIKDEIKLQAYQNQAQQAEPYINDLCNLQSQVIYLASSDPAEDNKQYATNLQANIQRSALNDLRNIWDSLEGNGTKSLPGLINRWSDLVGPKGYPTFVDSAYLKSAVPNLQYYLIAEAVGFNLQVEFAHTLNPSLAKKTLDDTFRLMNQHVDAEFKRVAHDIPIKRQQQDISQPSTDTGLYASVILPAAFDKWKIDTRTEAIWIRFVPGCTYQRDELVYYTPERVANCVAPINKDISDDLVGTGLQLDFVVPSNRTWAGLIDSPRESAAANQMRPLDWLIQNGFLFKGYDTYSFWSSTIADASKNAHFVVDLKVKDPNNGQYWWAVNGQPITKGYLLLESDSANKYENTLFYKEGQYKVTPEGSGLK